MVGTHPNLPRFHANVLVPLAAVAIVASALLSGGREGYSDLHTLLDTSDFLLSGILALLFWGAARRLQQRLLRLLTVSFMVASALELLHALAGIEWYDSLEGLTRARDVLRPATWTPAAYILPIGLCIALWRANRSRERGVVGFPVALFIGSALMVGAFYWLPRYTTPSWLGITRPTLTPVPLLWAAIAAVCWRRRAQDRIYPTLSAMAAVLIVAHIAMLYSRAPHDALAIVAHLGKAGGYLAALLSLMEMASEDMLERIRAEQALARLNAELEDRVHARTDELQSANENYREAQRKLASQLERLSLLARITHLIGERQDLPDVYGVVLRELEDHLHIDFGCVATYQVRQDFVSVARVGERSQALARNLEMPEGARISIDANGLTRCMSGRFVYEPDITQMDNPFPRRLAQGGLRTLVLAPLLVESKTFGVLVAARRSPTGFTSGECEFFRQLSEHVALAASQAQTYTALQQAYEELRLTTRSVLQQERLRALGQMASGIAHDINNALSPVSLYAGLLIEHEHGMSPSGREHLETIERAVADVGKTVARLREFYRPRESQSVLAQVDLNRLVTQVIELTRARWSDLPQQRGVVIEVKTELWPELPPTPGAESEIRDALTNLVFNAVDAMPGGGTLTLRTSVGCGDSRHDGPDAKCARIDVQDTGMGMDEETRRRCMEPFFTTKGDRGTGLGLAGVYGMIERHSGSLDIESQLGRGTTVRLLFPVSEPGDWSAPERRDLQRPKRSLRILIVDDDPVIIESLLNALRGDGHSVSAADGGQAGIDAFANAAARGEAFDIVITDLGMPYVDGRKVALSIAARSPSTPIVLLTGWGQRLIDDNELPPAVHRVLAKPPRLSELRSALSALCPGTERLDITSRKA